MNIFAIEGNNNKIDWSKSAKSQDNYRVVKMILESTQMLCSALNILIGEQVTPYRTTHKNHPSTKWVRESSANFESLMEHTMSMLEEYTERFNRIHKCAAVVEQVIDLFDPSHFPSHSPTPLPLCMPDEFKTEDVVTSYRKFYASKPKMRYAKSKVPPWFSSFRTEKFELLP